jgi:hypothetical protein
MTRVDDADNDELRATIGAALLMTSGAWQRRLDATSTGVRARCDATIDGAVDLLSTLIDWLAVSGNDADGNTLALLFDHPLLRAALAFESVGGAASYAPLARIRHFALDAVERLSTPIAPAASIGNDAAPSTTHVDALMRCALRALAQSREGAVDVLGRLVRHASRSLVAATLHAVVAACRRRGALLASDAALICASLQQLARSPDRSVAPIVVDALLSLLASHVAQRECAPIETTLSACLAGNDVCLRDANADDAYAEARLRQPSPAGAALLLQLAACGALAVVRRSLDALSAHVVDSANNDDSFLQSSLALCEHGVWSDSIDSRRAALLLSLAPLLDRQHNNSNGGDVDDNDDNDDNQRLAIAGGAARANRGLLSSLAAGLVTVRDVDARNDADDGDAEHIPTISRGTFDALLQTASLLDAAVLLRAGDERQQWLSALDQLSQTLSSMQRWSSSQCRLAHWLLFALPRRRCVELTRSEMDLDSSSDDSSDEVCVLFFGQKKKNAHTQ